MLLSEEFIHRGPPPLFFFSTHTYTENRAAASRVWCRKCSISSSGEDCDIWPQGFKPVVVCLTVRAHVFVCVCVDMKGLSHLLNQNCSVTTSSTLKDCFIAGNISCVCVCVDKCADTDLCQWAFSHLPPLPIATSLTLYGASVLLCMGAPLLVLSAWVRGLLKGPLTPCWPERPVQWPKTRSSFTGLLRSEKGRVSAHA